MEESTVSKSDGLTNRLNSNGESSHGGDDGADHDDSAAYDDEECDAAVWDTLSGSFRQAQLVLDQNHALIQEVNENHQSKIPDNLVKNVSLIRQINGNISKVLSIYSDLSINFSNIVHQRRRGIAVTSKNEENENSDDEGNSAEHVLEKSQMIEGLRDCIPTISARRYEVYDATDGFFNNLAR